MPDSPRLLTELKRKPSAPDTHAKLPIADSQMISDASEAEAPQG